MASLFVLDYIRPDDLCARPFLVDDPMGFVTFVMDLVEGNIYLHGSFVFVTFAAVECAFLVMIQCKQRTVHGIS